MMASVRVISRRSQGRMRQCMNPSITTCPASVPVMVLLWPLASKRHGEQGAGQSGPQQRSQGQIGDADPVAVRAEGDHLAARHRHVRLAVEDQRRQHQDRGVHEESDGQGHRGSMVLNRMALRMERSSFCSLRLCTRAECR